MLNLHLLECTLKGYDHISDLLLAKYWVITGCKYSKCKSLTSISIPDSVVTIETGAFCLCSNLKQLNIGNNVRTIGVRSFFGCSSLTNITIPNAVMTIGDEAFSWCNSLTNITIGKNVFEIGARAFEGCKIDTLVCYPKIPPRLNEDVGQFKNIIVQTGYENAYYNSDWRKYFWRNQMKPEKQQGICCSLF